jgi:hypothetical protein
MKSARCSPLRERVAHQFGAGHAEIPKKLKFPITLFQCRNSLVQKLFYRSPKINGPTIVDNNGSGLGDELTHKGEYHVVSHV